jgi:hypothetical protein
MGKQDLTGLVPESWCCVDCGVDTAPACLGRTELEKAFEAMGSDDTGVPQTFNNRTEVYTVRNRV